MSDSPPEPDISAAQVGSMLGAALVLAGAAWALTAAATWTYDGTAPGLLASLSGTARLISRHAVADPSTAYSAAIRRHMVAGPAWWLCAAPGFCAVLAIAIGAWQRVDALVGRSTLGRRRYDLRGARPRSWSRPRDVAHLVSSHRRRGRFTLGTLDGRLLLSDAEAHVAVVAPTRAGKTTRCVIPWLLEHDGPAVVTSTKTDVVNATRRWRGKLGHVTVWDPFGEGSGTWSPLAGCEDWAHALRQAQWLADAAQEGDSEIASYWRGEAARLLAPLLHAAAVSEGSMTDVAAWVDTQTTKQPVESLRRANAEAAVRQLSGVLRLDPRNRGTTYMSAGSLLAAYRHPEVAASSAGGFTAEGFLNGDANTLYVVASAREQRLLAPLVVAMLASVLQAAAKTANRSRPMSPTLRVLLDEAANIAPLRDLPVHLSQAAAHGVRVATFWQSIAQIEHAFGRRADDILANSTVKLFMGPITDDSTRHHVQGLLGEEEVPSRVASGDSPPVSATWRPRGESAALQQLDRDRALLVEGRAAPSIVRLTPWWRSPRLRRRGRRTTL